MDAVFLKKAEQALTSQDPVLGALIATQTLEPREPRADYFQSLCRAIIGQQVSVAAATAIFTRFKTATNLEPQAVLRLTEADTKAIGLSRQKTTYITDLAHHFVENPDIYNHLETQTDEAVIAGLTAVKGIGTWTAQMFLMFTLNRPDVFAPDDAGLQRAMLRLYGWSTLPPKTELVAHADIWKPYRTVASLHLWHSLNNTPK
jgi:DNA-3-methyladenine glycosylase II